MRQKIIRLGAIALLGAVFAAFFTGCANKAQTKIDALLPRYEQAQIPASCLCSAGESVMITEIDGEELDMTFGVPTFAPPGLSPGKHTVGFYQVAAGTTTINTGARSTTTTQISKNMSVSTSSQQTQQVASFEKTSDLLKIEHDFEAGGLYMLGLGKEGKLALFKLGKTKWYWEYRVESKRADEAVVRIGYGSFIDRSRSLPLLLQVDGKDTLLLEAGSTNAIVTAKGKRKFAAIDKRDATQNKVAATFETEIVGDEELINISFVESGGFKITKE